MANQYKSRALTIATALMLVGTTSCEDTLSRLNPAFSWVNDPPRLALIAGGRLVVVEFNWFGLGYKVRPISGAVIPVGTSRAPDGPRSAGGRAGTGFGGGPTDPFVDPDLDEHDFDPDFWPEPEGDFPLPPLDIPEEDPFDGLPDPPPIDPDDVSTTNPYDGTLSMTNVGPGDFPAQNPGPSNFRGADGKPATSSKINIGGSPWGMVRTPDGLRTLVAYAQGIAVVDRKARTVVDRIPLPPGSVPRSIAITPDGRTAYVTSFVRSAAELYVGDLASKKVIATLSSGGYAARVVMKPDGTQAWFTSFFDDSVTVIDVASNTLGVTIGSILNAWDIKFNPTGTRAYVCGPTGSGDVINVIDTSTYSVIAKIPVGFRPKSMIVTPSGRHLFVANFGSDTITQIDTITNKVVRNITVGKKPHGFQILH